MATLTLTEQEVSTILAALAVVTPTGGGSAVYSLARKITAQAEVGCEIEEIAYLANVALAEAVEAGVVVRVQ